jgi:hypothetical protein
MFIWSGTNEKFHPLSDGFIYNVSTGVWKAISKKNAPGPRLGPTCVWSGEEFLVWGGSDADGNPIGTGGKFDSTHDKWTDITATNAPEPRSGHTAVWDGSRMIIWGGSGQCCNNWFNDGFAYKP